jgi:ankyrin repeat protein
MGLGRLWNSVTTKIWLFFGSDVNNEKYAYLHNAVYYQDENLINYLLDRKADINLANKDGYTALYLALKENDIQAANVLFEKGAVLDMNMKGHATLLHKAVKEKQPDIINLLIKKGLMSISLTKMAMYLSIIIL